MRKRELERLVGEMAHKVNLGQKLLPWPELPQDLAVIAFYIDAYRAAQIDGPPPPPPPRYLDPYTGQWVDNPPAQIDGET